MSNSSDSPISRPVLVPPMDFTEALKELSLVGEGLENDEEGLEIDTMTVEERLQQINRLNSLGKLYLEKYQKSKQREDLDLSIKSYEKASHLVGDDTRLLTHHYEYAIALFERYSLLQASDDLGLAISLLERVVGGTPEESGSEFTHRSGFLSTLHYIRYKSSGDISDLSHAIEAMRKSVHANPGNEKLLSNLNNLSVFLYQRFQLSPTHDLIDISDAISYQNRLVDSTTESDENSPFWLERLAGLLEARFKYTEDIEDLSAAVSALDKAIQMSPVHDANKVRRLGKRGILYRQQSHYKGNSHDILRAVEDHEEALRMAPDDYPDLYEVFENLGNSYLEMYHQTEDIAHVSEAVTALENAVGLIPEDNPDAPYYWSNLGAAYLRLFECTGAPHDLSEAISAQERSLQFEITDNLRLSSLYDNLGDSYQMKFEISGNILDISNAIAAHQQAIHLMPERHVHMANRLNNIGTALQCRAERTGDIVDIREAIDAHRKAVKLCHSDNSNLPLLLSNLGNAIFSQFKLEVEKNLKDIDESISLYQQALSIAEENEDSAVATYYDNLSIAQRVRFGLGKLEKDIDDSISSAEAALNLAQEGRHLDAISRLNNFATALCARFEHTKVPADISKAILSLEKAIHMLPSEHPWLCSLLFNLANCVDLRKEIPYNVMHDSDDNDSQDSAQIYKRAALLTSGPLTQRLKASQWWAKLTKPAGKTDGGSLEAYKMAISLVSQVTGMEKNVGLRYRNLIDTSISTLPSEAAASAFTVGDVESAIEFLEQGRCIVWKQIHNLRTPFDRLSSVDQDLADELSRVARDLEASGLRNETIPAGLEPVILVEKMGMQEEATNSARLAQRWEALLAKARSIPGLEDFLLPLQYHDIIRRVPDTGYVVLFNIHAERCDAIALGGPAKKAIHIPLDLFTYDDAVRLVRLQDTVLDSNRSRSTEDEIKVVEETRGSRPYLGSSNPMQAILGELWTRVVNPVIQGLGIKSPMDDFKRIWWCPTGPLCFLPIHAAGIYNSKDNMCLSDFVVSSYIPTVNTLIDLSEGISEFQPRKNGNVLVIGQEGAPGLLPLPGATKEVNVLKRKFDSEKIQFSCLEGSVATMERAMTDMATFNYIHFACHAIQDTDHPLRSGFYLSDGRLELWNMLKVHNRDAELAFLSACQTARGNSWLWEEVTHLGAGMLAVGYRGAVATMWSIQDRYGAKMAEDFYSDLFNIDDSVDNLGRRFGAAGSLHSAVSRLRAEIGDLAAAMLAWVPYVHMGV